MTAPTFEDLEQYGIVNGPVEEARDALVHGMLAEDFLAHMGIDVPDEPTDEFYADADSILAHYGVLGMRWGRRRNPDGTVTINKGKQAGNHPGHSDRKSGKPKPRSAKSMTTEELQSAIKRMQLEQQYTQLVTPKKPQLLAETQKIVTNALRQNAQTYVTQYTGVAIGAALKKAGVPNAAEIAARAREASKEEKKD